MSLVGRPARYMVGMGAAFHSILHPERPYREPDRGELKPIAPGGDFIMVECEMINPPSMEGRKMWLALYDDDVTDLLLVLRERAIQRRSQSMKGT